MIGAIVMRSAGRTSALRTSTLSPRLTPTFRRTRPSIRMIPLPSSSCITRNSFAAVDFLPRIWMISPTSTPSATRVFVSTRARPSPTSDWGASATLRIIRSGTTVRTPRAYIKVMARIPGRANRPSQRWFSAALDAPFLDLARLVDNEVLRDDEVHAAMRSDADVLTFNRIRREISAGAEKASGGPHGNVLRFNRFHPGGPAELDVHVDGLERSIDLQAARGMEVLCLDIASDVQRTARRNIDRFETLRDLGGSAHIDILSEEGTRNPARTRGTELDAADIPVEVARPRDPRGLALEVPAHMGAARGSELDGLDRIPRDHPGSHDPDRFTANLRAKAREVNGTHRLPRDAHRVLRGTRGFLLRPSDGLLDR